nr:hypothetical protein Iba_chr13fCG12040 [Ipomoea batatas]
MGRSKSSDASDDWHCVLASYLAKQSFIGGKPQIIFGVPVFEKCKEEEDLARAGFDDYVAILPDGTSLLRIGLGCPCICLRLEMVLLVRHGQ